MWRANVGKEIKVVNGGGDDDWETDADFQNDVSEKESRWGSKTIAGSGHQAAVNLDEFRKDAIIGNKTIQDKKEAFLPKPTHGYGGKFGVETDKMDKCAENFEYHEQAAKHVSQTDQVKGFGGKFGVQADRQDKSAAGYDYKEQLAKHESQVDQVKGFGGKFGVQTDRKDKSAMGYEDKEELAKHDSQKDHSKGFGGKFGVDKTHQDKSAAGWDYQEKVAPHESQNDHTKGYGGKFGVQTDRQDKSAAGWDHQEKVAPHESQNDHTKGYGGKFGVQTDRQDKSAAGWDHQEKVAPHESQNDHTKGYGGKFGVQTDRQDKSAGGWGHQEDIPKHESQKPARFGVNEADRQDRAGADSDDDDSQKPKQAEKPAIEKGRASNLKSRFEQLANQNGEDRVAVERERRRLADLELQKEQKAAEEQRQAAVERQWADRQLNQPDVPAAEENGHEKDNHRTDELIQPKRQSRAPPGAVSVMHGMSPQRDTQPVQSPTRQSVDEPVRQPSPPPQAQPPPQPSPFVQANQSVNSTIDDSFGSEPEPVAYHPPQYDYVPDEQIETPAPAPVRLAEPEVIKAVEPEFGRQYDYVPDDDDVQAAEQAMLNSTQPTLIADASSAHPLAAPAHPMADTGVCAVAVYDYQAADTDEISFEPDDLITNIEMVIKA